ncbi:hypothetical protein DK412_25465 [Methylobacterium sp. 17Sr1-1]|nr:hypothetical protein DK412_25465 [Methylobacterium sp. 17Sr1-1]
MRQAAPVALYQRPKMLTHQRRSRAGPRSTRPLTHLECSTPSRRLGEKSRTEPKVVFNDRWY